MPDYRYLIIGGGMTADAAVKGIRQADPLGSIGMICAEPDPPYNRPPLSKGLWHGLGMGAIWRGTEDALVTLHLGRAAVSLDPDLRRVTDDAGETYSYEKLLLATGADPRRMPFGEGEINYLRTVEDYRSLKARSKQGGRFAVVGAGFIGSEIAAALREKKHDVVMLYPGGGIGGRVFPEELSVYLVRFFERKGVEMLGGERVQALERREGRSVLLTQAGTEIIADHVIAGIGVIPNTALAEQAALEVDNGIRVDEHLRTKRPDIFAAGDVASFYSPVLDTYRRVEHEDNANEMGRVAGLNMAGVPTPYHHLPFFNSELFGFRYEGVGNLDSRMETLIDWRKPFKKGVVYYMDEGRVRGVLFWNLGGKVNAARRLIAAQGPFRAADLRGRI